VILVDMTLLYYSFFIFYFEEAKWIILKEQSVPQAQGVPEGSEQS